MKRHEFKDGSPKELTAEEIELVERKLNLASGGT